MKTLNLKSKYNYLIIFSLIILFIFAFIINSEFVILRDYNLYPIVNSFFIMILLIILLIFYMLNKNSLLVNRIYLFIISALTILLIFEFIRVKDYNNKVDYFDNNEISMVNMINSNENLFYFYRDDCIFCNEIDEPLKTYIKDNDLFVYKIDTSKVIDKKVFDEIGLYAVPSIFYLENDKIVERYDYDEIKKLINEEINI